MAAAVPGPAGSSAPPTTIEGARLRLRPWRDEDRAPFAAMNADPAVMRHFPATLSRADSDAMLDRIRAHHAAHGWGFWCVESREGGAFLGMVGLQGIPWQARFTPAIEIGWRIAPPFQRRGFAEEAARLALRFGFGTLALAEIVAFTIPANAPSWRLMEKLGMAADGMFDHPRLPQGHPMRPHRLYRLAQPC